MLGVGGAGQSTSSPCSAMAAGCWLATATGDCQPKLRRAACLRIQVLQSGQVYLNRCSFSSPPASLVVQQVRNAGLCMDTSALHPRTNARTMCNLSLLHHCIGKILFQRRIDALWLCLRISIQVEVASVLLTETVAVHQLSCKLQCRAHRFPIYDAFTSFFIFNFTWKIDPIGH